MIHLRDDLARRAWLRRVRDSLRARGFYYEPEFCAEVDGDAPVLSAAELLGRFYVPAGTAPDRPVILTHPSPSAPDWRPFDRRTSIGWHNDFSTRPVRPVLSLSLIRRGDPDAPSGGAWRVASVSAVLAKLCRTQEGKRLISALARRAEAFGYRDAGGWRPFRVLIKEPHRHGSRGMRFYGRALEEGARLRFGQVPDRTRELVARVDEAADAVGEVLPAARGALLIVHNRLSLHDRTEQHVGGPVECRRQAWLCFVKRLRQPL